MSSLLYLGSNWQDARRVFDTAEVGRDAWNQPNELYGLTLSVWSDEKREYIVKATRNLTY
jgi:hypothetical protein